MFSYPSPSPASRPRAAAPSTSAAGPAAPAAPSGAASGAVPGAQIHLSTATAEQLDEVDGIGPTLAEAIPTIGLLTQMHKIVKAFDQKLVEIQNGAGITNEEIQKRIDAWDLRLAKR